MAKVSMVKLGAKVIAVEMQFMVVLSANDRIFVMDSSPAVMA